MGLDITVEFINGLKVGIEHMTADEEDSEYENPEWIIILDLLFIRIGIAKYPEE